MWERRITHTSATSQYWADASKFSDTVVEEAVGSFSVSRATLKYARSTPSGTQEDFAQFGLHMAVHVGAGSFVALTDTQKADAETDIDTLNSAIAGLQSNGMTWTELVWHDVTVGDQFYGPADRIALRSVNGAAATARNPDQIAVSVTFRTSSRRHWGRVYLPGMNRNVFDPTYGRVSNASCDTLAAAFRTFALALEANTALTQLLVYSHAHQAVMSIDEISVDNVPDVIRSRRPKEQSYRKTYSS